MAEERQMDLFDDQAKEDPGERVRPEVVEWLVRQGRKTQRRRLLWGKFLEAEVYTVN